MRLHVGENARNAEITKYDLVPDVIDVHIARLQVSGRQQSRVKAI